MGRGGFGKIIVLRKIWCSRPRKRPPPRRTQEYGLRTIWHLRESQSNGHPYALGTTGGMWEGQGGMQVR